MAANPNFLAGTAYIWVDGTQYMLVDASYAVTNVSRESLVGMDGYHGFSEKPGVGHIAATFRDAGNLSLAAINAMRSVTVQLLLANGKTIIGRNMCTVESQEVKTQEGTFEVKFEGPDISEQ